MAQIIYAKKVNEDQTEVEYHFWNRGQEQRDSLWINKEDGSLEISKGADEYEARLIRQKIMKSQERLGDANHWPQKVDFTS